MSASTVWELKADTYYRHKCRPGNPLLFTVQDVENYPVAVPLSRDDIVYCDGFVTREGSKGRGRYARLLTHRGGEHDKVVLFYRVSRNNRGQASWQELNPMLVIALADEIPTL
jgi:hypothetical protein